MIGDSDIWVATSDQFVLSCGAVAVDLKRQLVLLLRLNEKGYYVLPKGRKNRGESLEAAAIRECGEETGLRCSLLAHNGLSNATGNEEGSHMEPIAVQHRVMGHNERHLIVMWYLAQFDDESERVCLVDDGHRFTVELVGFDEALGKLHYDGDVEVVRRALDIVRIE